MKQFESQGVTFFHNEDFSGDVHMQHVRGPGFSVPFEALRAFVAPGLTLQLTVEQSRTQLGADVIAAIKDVQPRLLRNLAEDYREFAPLAEVLLRAIGEPV